MCQHVLLIYHPNVGKYSYSHLLVITGYFYGIIHSINGVFLVLITGILGHNCRAYMEHLRYKTTQHTTHALESSWVHLQNCSELYARGIPSCFIFHYSRGPNKLRKEHHGETQIQTEDAIILSLLKPRNSRSLSIVGRVQIFYATHNIGLRGG